MEAVLLLVVIALIFLFISFRRLKRGFLTLKTRVEKLESSYVPEEILSPDSIPEAGSNAAEDKIPLPEQTPKDNSSPEVSLIKKTRWKKTVIILKKFEHIFIEKWIAVIALVILVAGISFFGVWASTRISPLFRFWLIVFASFTLGGVSYIAGKYEKFQLLSVWLKSAGAAVFLFASLGAGGIPGIQWIESPVMGLFMLSMGITVNIVLAFIGKKQVFSSLHIVLGIVAVSIAPQSVVTLIVSTIVTFAGIAISFRKKWDLHHLISILFYFGFIIFWSYQIDLSDSFYNVSAVSAVIVTAMITLFFHYRRIYGNSGFEVTPLLVHLVNWLFLAVGLIKFAPKTDYVYIPLFVSGVLLFILAGRAKKLKIEWLFSTDTLISQLMILLSIMTLISYDISNFLIVFLLLTESLGFLFIIWREKEFFVHTVVFSFSSLAGLFLLYTGLESLGTNSSEQILVLSVLFTLSAVLASVLLLFLSRNNSETFFSGDGRKQKLLRTVHIININIHGAVIPLFVAAVYILLLEEGFSSVYWSPDSLLLPLFIALLGVKFKLKNLGMRISLIFFLALETLFSILYIGFEVSSAPLPVLANYFPVFLLSLGIIVYSIKKDGRLHKHIPGIYLITIHILFAAFFVLEDISGLFTGLGWLVFALIYLVSANLLKPGKLDLDSVNRLKENIINGGYLLILAFVTRFILFDIQKETMIFTTVRAEYILETVSFAVMGIWYLFNSRRRLLDLFFLELSLLFLIVVFFIEIPVTFLPAVFISLALILLFAGSFFAKGFSRLRMVSLIPAWISAFLIAFVTSPYLNPSLSYLDTPWIMSAAGILLQFSYLGIFHFTHKRDQITLPVKLLKIENIIYRLMSGKNRFLYYPVFASVLFFFIWSFNGAVLTALISVEALLILVLSILVKEDSFRYIALSGIIGSVVRLIFFDLKEADIFVKAVVFIVVSIIMLIMNILYNKFKDRIEQDN